MTSPGDRAKAFLALHRRGEPLLLPNPWDPGSARLLASLGYQALATTSGGFAATLGRFDGSVTAEEALGHAAAVVVATHLPVSADLEDAFARDPGGVATTVTRAAAIGLAGCSVEDFTRQADEPIYDLGLAVERVAAAAEVAHGGSCPLVLTARTERHLHGATDLAATVDRLQRFADAGADVVFAPGVIDLPDVARLVSELDRPVNVLVTRGAPPVAALAGVGVARISLGSGLALAALGSAVEAARQLLEEGTYGWFSPASVGRKAAAVAFGEAPPVAFGGISLGDPEG